MNCNTVRNLGAARPAPSRLLPYPTRGAAAPALQRPRGPLRLCSVHQPGAPSPAILGSVKRGGGSVAVAIAASNTAPYKSSQAATSSPKDGRRSPELVVTPRVPISRRAQMAARRKRPRRASRLLGAAREP